jgi:hypothetical protein
LTSPLSLAQSKTPLTSNMTLTALIDGAGTWLDGPSGWIL